MPIQLSGSGSITGVSTLTSLASLDVTGSVSVGGTLIYDDVTNIDSLGIVTARSDVHIGAGLSVTGISTFNAYLDINGDINIDGSQITYTSSSNELKFADNAQLRFGSGNDLRIYHNGSHSYISESSGTGDLRLVSSRTLIRDENDANHCIIANSGGSVDLYHNGSKKFETTADGVDISGTISDSIGPLRSIPMNTQNASASYTLQASDAGKVVHAHTTTTTVVVPNSVFSSGDAVSIVNGDGSNTITISQGSGFSLRNTADSSTGNRTLAVFGMATIYFTGSGVGYISGSGLS